MFTGTLYLDARFLITGADTPIGAALAVRLAHLGAHLVLFGRDEEALEDIAFDCAEKADGDIRIEVCETPDLEELDAMLAEAWAEEGAPDSLVVIAEGGGEGVNLEQVRFILEGCGERWRADESEGGVVLAVLPLNRDAYGHALRKEVEQMVAGRMAAWEDMEVSVNALVCDATLDPDDAADLAIPLIGTEELGVEGVVSTVFVAGE